MIFWISFGVFASIPSFASDADLHHILRGFCSQATLQQSIKSSEAERSVSRAITLIRRRSELMSSVQLQAISDRMERWFSPTAADEFYGEGSDLFPVLAQFVEDVRVLRSGVISTHRRIRREHFDSFLNEVENRFALCQVPGTFQQD
jgi:transposase-like protein